MRAGAFFVWARRIVSERFFLFMWVLGRVKRLDGVCVFAGQGVFWWWGGFVVVVTVAFVLVRAFSGWWFLGCLWWGRVRESKWWAFFLLGFWCAIVYR